MINKISLFALMSLLLLSLFVVGCTGEATSTREPDALVVFAATSDVGLGSARIPLNIQMIDGTRIDDAADRLQVTYSLPGSDETRVVSDLKWRAWPIRGGIYTATMTFDRVGLWSIKVRMPDDDSILPAASGVLVKSATEAPDIGDDAPLTPTKTIPVDGDLRAITSAPEPDPDLYAISFDDAVAAGKPVVISFSTPAYCQSGTCGPQTDVLSKLAERYKGRASFIHVEIFDNPAEMLASGDPSLGIEAPVIQTWGFHTEPWTFVVDSSGIVAGRFESFATLDEIEEYLIPILERS
ncbi:MAG: thioredoxin family protein [Chloroflexi bacterium]|nr:thioredoxin family protein [Chloroflexota bacterium]